MKPPTIKELQAMTDEELSSVLGFDTKLKEAKLAIGKLDGLQGKLREEAETRVMDMFIPDNDLNWIADDFERRKKRGPKEEVMYARPDL